jgi:hypothetical protein
MKMAFPADLKARLLEALAAELGTRLAAERRRSALFRGADGHVGVAISYSDRHRGNLYWYGFHDAWHEFLRGFPNAYLILCLGPSGRYLLIPVAHVESWLPSLPRTERSGDAWAHVRIEETPSGTLRLLGRPDVRLDRYERHVPVVHASPGEAEEAPAEETEEGRPEVEPIGSERPSAGGIDLVDEEGRVVATLRARAGRLVLEIGGFAREPAADVGRARRRTREP